MLLYKETFINRQQTAAVIPEQHRIVTPHAQRERGKVIDRGNHLLASERSERDTLRSVQSRIVYILYIMVRANFVLITRIEGGV